ncbi:MAG: SRPBCC domain-containing protein [Thermoplasmatota archaeon]
MATLVSRARFRHPPARLYGLYLDQAEHAKATKAQAKVQGRVGGSFSAWDGYCRGKILHLDPNHRIVQTWRASDWGKADSILILDFLPSPGGCEVRLTQVGVPPAQAAAVKKGWQEYYWRPFRDYLKG